MQCMRMDRVLRTSARRARLMAAGAEVVGDVAGVVVEGVGDVAGVVAAGAGDVVGVVVVGVGDVSSNKFGVFCCNRSTKNH